MKKSKKPRLLILLTICFVWTAFFSLLPQETFAQLNTGTIHSGGRTVGSPTSSGRYTRTDYVNPDGTTATRYTETGGPSTAPTTTTFDCSGPFSEWTYFFCRSKGPSSIAAEGVFDAAVSNSNTCRVDGWALDRDMPDASIDVHVYRDAPAGSGTFVMSCPSNTVRADVNAAKGVPGNHGFSCRLPASYQDGVSHRLFIHAIDVNGSPNNLLRTNGRWLTCAAPSVSLTASDCAIPRNGTSCQTTISYAFYNVQAPRQVWNLTTGVLLANANAPATFTRWITLGTHTLVAQGNSYAPDNGIRYAYAYPTAYCTAGTSWDGTRCTAPAFGWFESVNPGNCSVAGWAIDMDDSIRSIPVHVYRDNSAFSGGTYVTSCATNALRTDVNTTLGVSGNHGFNCTLPASYLNTGNHNLYIHAIDRGMVPNNLLSGNPKALDCSATANITATNCEIASGATSCNSTVNWQFNNAPNAPTCSSRQIFGVNQTTSVSTLFANCTNPGTNVVRAISHGTHRVSARYNGTEIASTPVITASCAAGTAWNGTRCIPPPTINLSAQITQFPGVGVPVTTTITSPSTASIAPGARVRLVWTTTNATSCTNNFGAAAVISGTFTDASYDGVPTGYSVTCTNVAGTVTASIGASIPEYELNFTTTKALVRSGEQSSLMWDIKLKTPLSGIAGLTPYSLTCSVRGATTANFTTPAKQTGSALTQPLQNSFVSTLTCTELVTTTANSATVENEVIPRTEEI